MITEVAVSDVENNPVIIFAQVMKGGLPVLGAKAVVDLTMPSSGDSQVQQIVLRDDGLGKWSLPSFFKAISNHILSTENMFPYHTYMCVEYILLSTVQIVDFQKNVIFYIQW